MFREFTNKPHFVKDIKSKKHLEEIIDNNESDKTPKLKKRLETNKMLCNIREVAYKLSDLCERDMPNPGVDMTLIYSKSFTTKAAFFFDKVNETDIELKDSSRVVYKGGDNTVTTDGLILPPIMWLYENVHVKKNGIKVNFVDYCSNVNSENLYKKSSKNNMNNNNYTFLNCSCRNIDTKKHGTYKSTLSNCDHASMLGDSYVSEYISDLIDYLGDNNKDFIDYKAIKLDPATLKETLTYGSAFYKAKCTSLIRKTYSFKNKEINNEELKPLQQSSPPTTLRSSIYNGIMNFMPSINKKR